MQVILHPHDRQVFFAQLAPALFLGVALGGGQQTAHDAVAALRVKGAHHVFFHGQPLEQADILEGTSHAEAGDLVLLQLGDVLAVQ